MERQAGVIDSFETLKNYKETQLLNFNIIFN